MVLFVSCQESKTAQNNSKISPAVLGSTQINPRVIYGDDNRLDVYDAPDLWKTKSDSTVALMKIASLTDLGNGLTKINGQNYGTTYGLCPEEPFKEQDTAAFCSGSLVAPDVILSAGHCMRSAIDCGNTKYVFGFALKQKGVEPQQVSTSEVYSCKEIIKTVEESAGADFSLVRLDRPVQGHTPLNLNRTNVLTPGSPLLVIGHPCGIPVKVSGGANIRKVNDAFYVANLDTYGGNSGSAVFNETTGNVEGVLVRGEADFVYQNGCRVSNKCPNEGCRGEDVTRIDQVLPFLPSLE